jgi:hypothetical protein
VRSGWSLITTSHCSIADLRVHTLPTVAVDAVLCTLVVEAMLETLLLGVRAPLVRRSLLGVRTLDMFEWPELGRDVEALKDDGYLGV